MSPLDLALQYMEIVYSGRDLARLNRILSADLIFEGPFFRADTAREYIDSLLADPPDAFEYEILHAFESGGSANLIYEFSKPGVLTPMSQLFDIVDGRIARILLIFDSDAFSTRSSQ